MCKIITIKWKNKHFLHLRDKVFTFKTVHRQIWCDQWPYQCSYIVNLNDKTLHIKVSECTMNVQQEPNEESQITYMFHWSFSLLESTFGENCSHFFYCNQQDTNGLEHWSACTHAPFGQTKMEKCTHLICVYFNLNLCAKWNQIKCWDRVTFAFVMCRNSNYSFSVAIFAISSMWKRKTIYSNCLITHIQSKLCGVHFAILEIPTKIS